MFCFTNIFFYVKLLKVSKEKNMVDKRKCISCGTCIDICPVGAISWGEDGKAQIDPNKCIKCHSCESMCPVGAITIED